MHQEYDFAEKIMKFSVIKDGFVQRPSHELDADTKDGTIVSVNGATDVVKRSSPEVIQWLVNEVKTLARFV